MDMRHHQNFLVKAGGQTVVSQTPPSKSPVRRSVDAASDTDPDTHCGLLIHMNAQRPRTRLSWLVQW